MLVGHLPDAVWPQVWKELYAVAFFLSLSVSNVYGANVLIGPPAASHNALLLHRSSGCVSLTRGAFVLYYSFKLSYYLSL